MGNIGEPERTMKIRNVVLTLIQRFLDVDNVVTTLKQRRVLVWNTQSQD